MTRTGVVVFGRLAQPIPYSDVWPLTVV